MRSMKVSIYWRPTDQRPTGERPHISKNSNGHISATDHPIHFMFGSRVGFSRTNNLMASFKFSPGWPLLPRQRNLRGKNWLTGEPAPVKAGTRFTYPGWMEGWVDLGAWLHTRFTGPQTVTHPTIRCRITALIETSVLPLSQATTVYTNDIHPKDKVMTLCCSKSNLHR